MDDSKSSDRSKRVIEDIGDDSDVGDREASDSVTGNSDLNVSGFDEADVLASPRGVRENAGVSEKSFEFYLFDDLDDKSREVAEILSSLSQHWNFPITQQKRTEEEAEPLELRRKQEARELELRRKQEARELELRRQRAESLEEARIEMRRQEMESRKRANRELARPLEGDWDGESSENGEKYGSTALVMHREKRLKRSDQEAIRWKPLQDRARTRTRSVPSLLDLSLKVLADNADRIVSLKGVPDSLKRRLSNLVCDVRKMNVKVLDLFVRGSPSEIRIKDSSWISDSQFKKSFGSFDPGRLSFRVLNSSGVYKFKVFLEEQRNKFFNLTLCGQCVADGIISQTLAKFSNSLPGLSIISLRGACHLSDESLKVLARVAPALCSVNLGECSLITHVGISYLANTLRTSLREIFIDNCPKIDAVHIASELNKFEHLEVLSVAGIPSVSDGVISDIITACGRNIKDLDLADCERLTDSSLKIIGQACSDLRALNIVNLHNLTDDGLSNLADGCRSIRSLKLCRNKFSDEAIAAFVEIAGGCLEELSLNHVRQVGSCTVLSLAKFSRNLSSLDLSWCRQVTDEALGLIVDSRWKLKLLKLFGCTQVSLIQYHSDELITFVMLSARYIVPFFTEELHNLLTLWILAFIGGGITA